MPFLQRGMRHAGTGDNTTVDVELITPVAMQPGMRFNMREGGMTVGTGIITKILG